MENTTIIQSLDPEMMEPILSRRDAIAKGATASSKVMAALALGSIPIALGALAKDVYGQTPQDVVDVLKFALTLEYLESDFYTRGVAAAGLIPASDVALFTNIRNHENTHVTALQGLITQKGSTYGQKPVFDYTAKGALPGFNFGSTQYATFQALAQAFEDTGVRAYKGQAGRLIGDKAVLTAALTIHSVEARHAAEVRRLRGQKGWITGKSRDTLPAFTQGIYDGEENVTHAGTDITGLGTGNGGVDALTEAYDEPLTQAQVLAIVGPFLA
ncbi:MAG: ferritin-like domain-containing protein [Vicinamibacterales bacterium]